MNSSSNISNSNNNISNNDQNVGFKNQSQPKKIITSVDDLNPFKDQDEVEVIEKKIQNEIKIEQNSSKSNKRSVVVLNFFKKIFGIAILTDEQKEQIKSFNKEKDLFKKDFKSLFSLFNKLKKFEKTKENELPNQSSLKLVQTNLNAQGLILIQMGMRISRMNQSSLAINEISSKFKKYSDLSKQLEGMNQQYQKLNKRLIINRSLMDLEQTIVKYRDVIKNSSFGSFDAYSRILNQKGIIENQLRNAIQQRPELLRNQEIVRILKAKELSPAAIKQLVKLSYPKMSPYVNRLMNQLDLIKESRLDGLMKQQKKIDNLSSQITVLNKYVEKKEKQLNKWSFITYILNFGSKEKLQSQINSIKAKTIELTNKQSEIKFEEMELEFFKAKTSDIKAQKIIGKINKTFEHTQFLNARKNIVESMLTIEKLIKEIRVVKNAENHDHLKESNLKLKLDDEITKFAQLSKNAFLEFNENKTIKEDSLEGIKLVRKYLKQTFPSMTISVDNFIKKLTEYSKDNIDLELNVKVKDGFNQVDDKKNSENIINQPIELDDEQRFDNDYEEIFRNNEI